jgi:hypothetical protein
MNKYKLGCIFTSLVTAIAATMAVIMAIVSALDHHTYMAIASVMAATSMYATCYHAMQMYYEVHEETTKVESAVVNEEIWLP